LREWPKNPIKTRVKCSSKAPQCLDNQNLLLTHDTNPKRSKAQNNQNEQCNKHGFPLSLEIENYRLATSSLHSIDQYRMSSQHPLLVVYLLYSGKLTMQVWKNAFLLGAFRSMIY
jgi:hypothetical protein